MKPDTPTPRKKAPARPRAARGAAGARPAAERGARVLVAGTEGDGRRTLARDLLRLGLDVRVAAAADVRAELAANAPLLLVCRADDAGIDVHELVRMLATEHPRAVALVVVDGASLERVTQAPWADDPHAAIARDDAPGALLLAVRDALLRQRLTDERGRLADVLERQTRSLAEVDADLRSAIRVRSEQIANTKRLWERSFDAINTPLAVVDERGGLRLANQAYARAADRPIKSIVGGRCHELLFGRSAPCAGCPLAAGSLATVDESAIFEIEGRGADDPHSVALFRVRADHVDDGADVEPSWVCTYRDVSGEKRMMKAAGQVERMAAVGQLAAGVAHELNNPLGGILALTQVLLRDLKASPDDTDSLKDIEEAALRCKRIIEALLVFARGPRGGPDELVRIDRVVDAAVAVVRSAIRGAGAREEVFVEPNLPPVLGSPSLLVQAIVALVTNSVEALATLQGTDHRAVVTVRALKEGEHVLVEVSDNGPGVPEETRAALFTPLTSGRNSVEGAGFGLATVSRIAHSHQGHVEALSGPEGGALFRIVLPAAAEPGSA